MFKITSFIVLFITTPSLFLAQADQNEIHLQETFKATEIVDKALADFNDKYYTLFVESYKNFAGIENKKTENPTNAKIVSTSIDFEKGENEQILLNNNSKTFQVTFDCNQDLMVATAMQQEISNRIISVSPKGFVKTKVQSDSDETLVIAFDPTYPEKAAYQPTIELIIDYQTLTVQVLIHLPLKSNDQ